MNAATTPDRRPRGRAPPEDLGARTDGVADTMGVFDRLTGDGERSDADVHHECRECGRTLSGEATECPDCGGDVATYEL